MYIHDSRGDYALVLLNLRISKIVFSAETMEGKDSLIYELTMALNSKLAMAFWWKSEDSV